MTSYLSPSRIFLVLLAASSQALCSPRVAQAWYGGWHSKDFPPSNVSWSKYTHMTFAFAAPQEDWTVLSLDEFGGHEALTEFVKEAKAHNVKALVTIGGWTGSRFFSPAVGSQQNRTMFVQAVTDFAVKYGLDGLDFDWEYPNRQGLGCNVVNSQDTPNFISFLEDLRKHSVGGKLILTAATSITPFNDANGKPAIDLSKFGSALDYVALMAYDIWGPWLSAVGPNGPLNDTCASVPNQQGSGISAVTQWHKAGIPHEKILLGLPAYGHAYKVKKADAFKNGSETELIPYPRFDANGRPAGDRWDDPEGKIDPCGVKNPAGGIFSYWGLIENGFLDKDGTPKYPNRFDDCSKGAFVYNPQTEVMVAYDNPQSWSAKGQYIADAGLGGFAVWQAGDDYHDMLLNAVRRGSGMAK
ncbi:hypothetical protein AAF712_006606 [Marasmius tenuissimus]|uniref:GH18 domain-containing protein n=1 Tax=Marasmius tenuissimus TaxID=585030 RepID=A0ABR2ZXD2_9AGAR